ncbi:MAG: hypothetical protein HY459_00615 [Parcubacteria group bacterium]|nr:hypothetical protein [Parcubacteria group bacterium]
MAILVDGDNLAREWLRTLKKRIALLTRVPRIGILSIQPSAVNTSFIERKLGTARELNVMITHQNVDHIPSLTKMEELLAIWNSDPTLTGYLIQLPLPEGFESLLLRIPPEKDIDLLNPESLGRFLLREYPLMPPVVRGIEYLAKAYHIDFASKRTLIVGAGRLVGKPTALWFLKQDIPFEVATERSTALTALTRQAQIIITGVGKVGLITDAMITEGVVLIDAGSVGVGDHKVTGDLDYESCKRKASLITPVPGGLGPLTVTALFENVIKLAERGGSLLS